MLIDSIHEIHPPLDSIRKVTDAIKLYGIKRQAKENTIITPKSRKKIYVAMGLIDVFQKDPLYILGTLLDTIPIGIVERYQPMRNIFYKLKHDCDIFSIDYTEWDVMLKKNELYEDVIAILSYSTHNMLLQIEEILTGKTIDIIKNLIYRYNRLNNISPIKETLCNFILSRSTLSRSLVMSVIAEYKKNGNIELKKGFMIKINSAL